LLLICATLIGSVYRAGRDLPTPQDRLTTVQGLVRWSKEGLHNSWSCRIEGPENLSGLKIQWFKEPVVVAGDTIQAQGLLVEDDGLPGNSRPVLKATSVQIITPRSESSRAWAFRTIEKLEHHGDMAQRLLLGFGLSQEDATFRVTGLLHLLAVSGMHLAIVLVAAAWILGQFSFPHWVRPAILLSLAIAYSWLAGWQIPILRTAIMTLAVILADLGGRRIHRLGPLSLAVLAILLWQPSQASDVSFQLSAGAVAGICTLGIDLMRLRRRHLPLNPWPLDTWPWRGVLWLCRSNLDGLAVGLAATTAVFPVIAWHFHQATPWGILATMVVSIPITLALGLGLVFICLSGLWPTGPWEGLGLLFQWAMDLSVRLAELAAALPYTCIRIAPPSPIILLIWPLLLLIPVTTRLDLCCRLVAITLASWWML
jgi:ComEC/Rec2-related protein